MKTTEKKQDSEQAVNDKANVAVLQDKNSSQRDRDRAFGDLYSTHYKQVRINFLKKLRGNEEVAEDLLMITFQKVHESIGKYNPQYAFSTWLYKIANNSLIDFTRKAKFEVLSLDALSGKTSEDNDGMDFQIDSGSRNPEQLIVNTEVIQEVKDAIYGMKDGKIKDLIICRYLKEMTYAEAGKELGYTVNSTLRTSVGRGMKKLEKKLEHLKVHMS
jgi:RNA polymerase sigma-70 factor, ECF subfamily